MNSGVVTPEPTLLLTIKSICHMTWIVGNIIEHSSSKLFDDLKAYYSESFPPLKKFRRPGA